MYKICFKLLKTPLLRNSLLMGSTSFLVKAKNAVRIRDWESCFLLFSAFSMESADTSLGRFSETSGYLSSGSHVLCFHLVSNISFSCE